MDAQRDDLLAGGHVLHVDVLAVRLEEDRVARRNGLVRLHQREDTVTVDFHPAVREIGAAHLPEEVERPLHVGRWGDLPCHVFEFGHDHGIPSWFPDWDQVVRILPGTLLNSPVPGTNGNLALISSVSRTPRPGAVGGNT